MKFFWNRKSDLNSNSAYAPYEEIDVKRTSKLGVFFLILMVIFGVIQGNSFLYSVQESIDRPELNSACSAELARYSDLSFRSDPYYSYGRSLDYYDYEGRLINESSNNPPCIFSPREIALGLDAVFKKAEPLIKKTELLSIETEQLNMQVDQLRLQRSQAVTDYQAALVEDIAKTEDGVLDTSQSGIILTSQEDQISELNRLVTEKNKELSSAREQLKTIAASAMPALKKADKEYASDMDVYEFKQFLLSFILVAPLFFFVWRKYNHARLNRSEYSIIWGAVVATFGLIFAQILLVFVYKILPENLIKALLEFIAAFEILITLLQWLGFILVPLFFGFLIYLIQKKFYNKRAVMMRALKSGHCPNCSLKINQTMNNCPVCGCELKARCNSCGGMSMSGGAFCEVCGMRHSSEETHPQQFSPTQVR
jgi:hypothetical protein